MTLEGLEPRRVFYYFETLSGIPRGSGNEKAASDYLVEFAKKHGFPAEQDDSGNVIIRKSASPGCENAPVVMLQNHIDIVCEKIPEVEFDFETDSLSLVVDGDVIRANGTSLGADNGIGLAVALAILEDDTLVHPPLEVVCTVGEEIGLVGAQAMDMSGLQAQYAINSDSFTMEMVQTGCAGCVYTIAELPLIWQDSGSFDTGMRIIVGGLAGGHSGLDTCRQRANANKLMGRILDALRSAGITFALAAYACNNKDNAIARDAECTVVISSRDKEAAQSAVDAIAAAIKREHEATDPDFTCKVHWGDAPQKVFSQSCTDKAVTYLMLVPDGMFQKDFRYGDPFLAESSSNLGRVILESDKLVFRSMVRANFESRKSEVLRKMKLLTGLLGMSDRTAADSPTWEFDPDSGLLTVLHETCRELFGKTMRAAISHGTCECGYIKEKTGADVISIGPEIRHLHSPREEVDIRSVKALYDINVRILEKLAGK